MRASQWTALVGVVFMMFGCGDGIFDGLGASQDVRSWNVEEYCNTEGRYDADCYVSEEVCELDGYCNEYCPEGLYGDPDCLSVSCEPDGECNWNCEDDLDCFLECAISDGFCNPNCEDDPDCYEDECANDGLCNPSCDEDPDCQQVECGYDGYCDSECGYDPDCVGGCSCNHMKDICDISSKCSSVMCDCDPDCDKSSPCFADGFCDSWCPTDSDPDCAGDPDNGKHCD